METVDKTIEDIDQTQDQNQEVLGDDDVKVQGNFNSSWSFVANQEQRTASIQTGSKERGTVKTKERFVGRLKSITIRTWIADDSTKKSSQHLTATFLTKDGEADLEAWLSDMDGKLGVPNGVTIGFGWGLLQLKANEQACFQPSMGREKNKFGKFPLFVNVYHVKPNGDTAPVAKRPKTDDDMDKTWAEILAKLKVHPAWVEPQDPRTAIRPDSHLAELCKEAKSFGWATPQDDPAKWLRGITAAAQLPDVPNMLRDVDDDLWGELRQAILAKRDTDPAYKPKFLAPVAVD